MALGELVRPAAILANEELPPPRLQPESNMQHALISAASVSTILTRSSSAAISCQRDPVVLGCDELVSARVQGPNADVGRRAEETVNIFRQYKVPKPRGEVGRPRSGGYNLKTAMGWDDVRYESLKVCI